MSSLMIPGMFLVLRGLLIPLLPKGLRKGFAIALPFISCAQMHYMPSDLILEAEMFGYVLYPGACRQAESRLGICVPAWQPY